MTDSQDCISLSPDRVLLGRQQSLSVSESHFVLGSSLAGPFDSRYGYAMFGMGCFWGVEKLFWSLPGVISTAVGYSAGLTPNPMYEEVCTGLTGHNEVVRVVFDPKATNYQALLKIFWENHNPCSGMQQANDVGTQYRSGIYTYDESQAEQAGQSKLRYQEAIELAALPHAITTEIKPANTFYFAEEYHQQYLAKNPGGYCNSQSTEKTGLPCYR